MSKTKEAQPPYKTIINNRAGVLSQDTRLDQDRADQFMRVTDMRRNIVIVDSAQRPKRDAVAVGSDVLAFRAIEPIGKLTATVLKPSKYHTLVRDDNIFEVQVQERQIDADIRDGHFVDRSDYNVQFLNLVNRAVRDGLKEVLFREKIGLHDQGRALLTYGFFMSPMIMQNIEAFTAGTAQPVEPLNMLKIFLFTNLFVHFGTYMEIWRQKAMFGDDVVVDRKRNPSLRGDWKEAFLPLVPVDRWARGRLYLAGEGHQLIVPR